jgi:hypothetical protein
MTNEGVSLVRLCMLVCATNRRAERTPRVLERCGDRTGFGGFILRVGGTHQREFGPTGGSVVPAPSFVAERSFGSLSRQAKIDRFHRNPDTTLDEADGDIPAGITLV